MAASILIIDGDFQVRQLLERVLCKEGYATSTAENGRLAMATLRTSEFDLILLDIVLPDMDGLEFLRELLKGRPKLNVIAMSGIFHDQFLKAAKQMGAKAILLKPMSTEVLLSVINDTLTQASMDPVAASVMTVGALDVHLGKSKIQLDPAFTIETENILSIREDLIWVPLIHDTDGCLMQSDTPEFRFKLLWKELETITVLDTTLSPAEMCWKLKVTPIYDGHQVRLRGLGYSRISQ